MSQPIDVGAVLGGRYKVTELVLTSADGDAVLGGMDQVLNRSVSILVASPENASQVATSAREIATGERYGAMQVLDLGISDGSTYLITNTASPADLLDLVIQRDAPFIEPFYTDTLGSEIFGVTRSAEPEVYDDEEEYWEELQANEERNVGGRVAKRLTGFTSRLGRGKKASGSPEADAEAAEIEAAADESPTPAAEGSPEAHEHTESTPPTAAAADVPPRPQTPPTTPREPAESPAEVDDDATGETEKVSLWGAADKDASDADSHAADRGDGQLAAGAAAAAAGTAERGSQPVAQDHYERPAAIFPAGARHFSAPEEELDDEETEDKPAGGGFSRLLVGALLVVVLVIAVVFAFNTLGKNDAPKSAAETSQAPSAPGASSKKGESKAPSPKTAVEPEVTGISRVVPGNQALNAETDSTLPKAIDGNQGSLYSSYSFTTPQFGGFASNMALVVELKEEATISEVELSGLNGTGGAFQISVGDSEDLGSAKELTSGSFTGPTVTVPVSGDDDQPVKGKYVFFNITELPRLASTSNSSRPYGLQVAEIKVS